MMNAVSSCFPLSETATCLHHREQTFFNPYVMQILKQKKYTFKDLLITQDLGNLQRFVKFPLNSQKYQIPKSEKRNDDYATSFSRTPLFIPGGRKREMYVLHSPLLLFL